jgi:6-phosphogluconolactonase
MNGSPSRDIRVFASPAELARAAADSWVTELLKRPASDQDYSVAISGGRIAGVFFKEVSKLAVSLEFSFQDVHFFWADERCVGPSHPDSNFLLANTNLFEPLCVPRRFIHRIKGEADPEQAASQASQEVSDALRQPASATPVLDLVILGMGEDGHVASLFPGEEDTVVGSPAIYRAVTAPKPPPLRITIGYGVIFAARQVWVLVSGSGKQRALHESLLPGIRTPLGRVLHHAPGTIIFTDVSIDQRG